MYLFYMMYKFIRKLTNRSESTGNLNRQIYPGNIYTNATYKYIHISIYISLVLYSYIYVYIFTK